MIDRVGDRGVLAGDFERDVDDREIRRCRSGRDVGSMREGRGATMREWIGRHDRSAPDGAKHLDEQNADGPAPEHACRHAGTHLAEIECMDRHTERFEENGGRRVHRFREWKQEAGRPGNERSESAVRVAEPEKADVRTEVPATGQAQLAPLARVGRIDRDAEPAARSGRNDASDLVAKDE